jgi:Mor family transcriptional regulator
MAINNSNFMTDLVENIASKVCKELKTDPGTAKDIGLKVMENMRSRWGGQQLYICKTDKNGLKAKRDLADNIASKVSEKLKVAPEAAKDIGLKVMKNMCSRWGGQQPYICKTDKKALKARDEAILEAYKKEGFSKELSQQFCLSDQRIRQIVKRERCKQKEKKV